MKPPFRLSVLRFFGATWLASLVGFLFFGMLDFVDPPAWPPVVLSACAAAWICSGLFLAVAALRLVLRSGGPDRQDPRRALAARWIAACAFGVLGGVSATLANHAFPGKWTIQDDLCPEMLLTGLLGLIAGSAALAVRSRRFALLSFLFGAAFAWWVVCLNFR